MHGRYAVQSVLGDVGPFDVNYLAWDLQAEREVVAREYYPLRLAKRGRDGATLEVNKQALREARFSPAAFNGQPVAAWARFSVVFGER